MKYLLDSNAWIALLRNQSPSIADKVAATPVSDLLLCTVVNSELIFGALRSDPKRLPVKMKTVQDLLQRYQCLPLDAVAAADAAIIRNDLRIAGTPIGGYDLFIAAIARSNQHTLVTHNTREFSRVPNLLIEDWQV